MRRIRPRVWIAIVLLVIVIIGLFKAYFAITSATEKTAATTTSIATEETAATTTSIATEATTAKTNTVTDTTVEAEDENKMAKEKAETVEESSEAEEITQFTVDDPEATELIAYLGERPVNMQELPTFDSYVKSQEKAWMIDYKGVKNNTSNNDPRRLYFKVPIEEVKMEYESDGVTKYKDLEIEEVDSGLYRVTPPYSTRKHIYMTFKIVSDGKSYYMTWVPPIE